MDCMKDTRNAPCCWIRGWVALVVVAGFAHASCALAQIYKCTDPNGRMAFSDIPCATPAGASFTAVNTETASSSGGSPTACRPLAGGRWDAPRHFQGLRSGGGGAKMASEQTARFVPKTRSLDARD